MDSHRYVQLYIFLKNVVDSRPRRLLLIYYVYALYTVDVPFSVKDIVMF